MLEIVEVSLQSKTNQIFMFRVPFLLCIHFSFRDMYSKDDEDMKAALESSTIVHSTHSYTERTTSQIIQLFVLNLEKKSQPRLNKLARTLSFKLVSTYSSQVTHVAVRLGDPSNVIKANPHFYSAVLQGHFIVDFKCLSLFKHF